MAGKLRLDRYLAEMGLGSRTQIKEAAKKGRIRVNGDVEKRTERKIEPETDKVSYDGRPVSYVELEYYMLNKPKGVVSATEDRLHETAVDLIDEKQRKDLFPVGRLDIDAEGLLLITNDGNLAHRLLSPRRHVDKQYYALVEGRLPQDAKERFRQGIVLEDGTETMAARLELLPAHRQGGPGNGADGKGVGNEAGSEALVTIQEGKFHQVKRMFEALGCKVAYLKRLSMGPLRLDEGLGPGEYRALSQEEIRLLQELS